MVFHSAYMLKSLVQALLQTLLLAFWHQQLASVVLVTFA